MKNLRHRWIPLLTKIIGYGLVVFATVGLIAPLDSDLADNGDFTRAMTVFSSGPIDIHPNWPDPTNQKELWERRFLNFTSHIGNLFTQNHFPLVDRLRAQHICFGFQAWWCLRNCVRRAAW